MRMIDIKIATVIVLLVHGLSWGQCTPSDIEQLRIQGRLDGWTFTVGQNQATQYSLDELCGTVEPSRLRSDRVVSKSLEDASVQSAGLPDAFDWRQLGACTPVKNQGGSCDACWAFVTTAVMESAVVIRDGLTVDLSEQWLISCTDAGSCATGGFHRDALDYYLTDGETDACGGSGAVLESDLPYAQTDIACDCPYEHYYELDDWGFVGPDVESIKWAIYNYGPVATTIYANSAFQAYTGGIFNACESIIVNHAVVLVGWDDKQGTDGVWIVRNSWGEGWGEDGYMRIEYGCSWVEQSTVWVDYAGKEKFTISPLGDIYVTGVAGKGAFEATSAGYKLNNNSSVSLDWTISHTQSWLEVTPGNGSLPADSSGNINININSQAVSLPVGVYEDTLTFQDITNGIQRQRKVFLQIEPGQCVAWWKLDEINDQTVVDQSEYNNTGTVFGHPVVVTGKFAGALEFNGTTDMANCGDNAILRPAAAISIAAWVKANSLPADSASSGIVYNAFRVPGYENGYMLFAANQTFNWWVKTVSGSIGEPGMVSVAASEGEWTHLVGTYDGNRISFYMNGVEAANQPLSGPIQWLPASYRFYIAGYSDMYGPHMLDGILDDVRVYNYALNKDEVWGLYEGIRGDFNGDWDSDLEDVADFSQHWLSTDSEDYDLNENGTVDMPDFGILVEHCMEAAD